MMADKAVSTEDLWIEEQKISVAVSLVRLEAILQKLLENKVEALRNESRKKSSIHSGQKSILKRLRLMSTSSQSTIKNDYEKNQNGKDVEVKIKTHSNCSPEVENVIIKKSALKKDSSISSSTIEPCQCRMTSFELSSPVSEENQNNDDNIKLEKCPSVSDIHSNCYCNNELEDHTMHYNEDYVIIGMDPEKPSPLDDLLAKEALYRARKKRRKRRKKIMKKRMALAQNACYMEEGDLHDSYKHLTVDESSKRAKWTIVATAFLLLFMCLLLVGLTLRMAPIIDEMVDLHSVFDSIRSRKMCSNIDRKRDFLQVPDIDRSFSSRSSSFSESISTPRRLRKTVSLEEILFEKRKEKLFTRKKSSRRSTQFTPRKRHRKGSEHLLNIPKHFIDYELRRNSKLSSKDISRINSYKDVSRRSSRRDSSSVNLSRRNSSRRNSSRRDSYKPKRQSSIINSFNEFTEEERKKSKKRKMLVITIILIFFILAFISILAVVVSLTHRSTAIVQVHNATKNVTYYTFSADPSLLCKQRELGKSCS